MGNLLRAPRRLPSSIVAWSVSAAFPRYRRPGNDNTARRNDHAGQPILHIGPKCRVKRQLCRLRAPNRLSSMLLRGACPIIQLAPRVAALRRNWREIVDPDRPICRAICRTPKPKACWIASSSRSTNDRYRPDNGFDDRASVDGGKPPASRNQRAPTGTDTPAPIAASSLDRPSAINTQKGRRCVCCASRGRPGERSLLRNARSDRRPPDIPTKGVATIN